MKFFRKCLGFGGEAMRKDEAYSLLIQVHCNQGVQYNVKVNTYRFRSDVTAISWE